MSAGARIMATVFDCDVDVKTGQGPLGQVKEVLCDRSLS
jgi:hypothetical protein